MLVECGSAVEEGATHGFQHRPSNQRVHARSGVHLQDRAPDEVSSAIKSIHGERPFIMRDYGLGWLCSLDSCVALLNQLQYAGAALPLLNQLQYEHVVSRDAFKHACIAGKPF